MILDKIYEVIEDIQLAFEYEKLELSEKLKFLELAIENDCDEIIVTNIVTPRGDIDIDSSKNTNSTSRDTKGEYRLLNRSGGTPPALPSKTHNRNININNINKNSSMKIKEEEENMKIRKDNKQNNTTVVLIDRQGGKMTHSVNNSGGHTSLSLSSPKIAPTKD